MAEGNNAPHEKKYTFMSEDDIREYLKDHAATSDPGFEAALENAKRWMDGQIKKDFFGFDPASGEAWSATIAGLRDKDGNIQMNSKRFRDLYQNNFPPDPENDPEGFSQWKGDQDTQMLLRYFGAENVLEEMVAVMKEMLDYESVMMVVTANMQFKAERGEYRRREPRYSGVRPGFTVIVDEIDCTSLDDLMVPIETDPFTGRQYHDWSNAFVRDQKSQKHHDHLREDARKKKPR